MTIISTQWVVLKINENDNTVKTVPEFAQIHYLRLLLRTSQKNFNQRKYINGSKAFQTLNYKSIMELYMQEL